jgi:hypothetical protein
MKTLFGICASLLICCRVGIGQTTKPVPYDWNPEAGKFYDINGFKMYTEVYGSGPPLLMIHGIVCGDHDIISISHTVKIYQNIPHANLWVVPNSGHATLQEHADEFNKQADEFLTSPFVDHT